MTKRSKRKRTFFGLLALSTLAVCVGIVWLYRTVAPTSGDFLVAGISNPVTITFDAHERPFVRATTLGDALFAQGWLHAHHRLWQMEMFRRAGKGRLSELLGSSMLDSDKQLWRMGVPQLAKQLEANATESTKTHVDAYVGGINAAIGASRSRPPELMLLQTRPAFWTPSDVFALGALMAFQSAGNSGNEMLRLALLNEFGPERADIFFPDDGDRESFPYVIPKLDSVSLNHAIQGTLATDPDSNPLMPRFAFGSNGWVIAPSKSASGNALFAFDSHDTFGLPNLFYEVHLFFAGDQQIRGWSVAGLPGVINGYNEKLAWGFTNIGDTQDLFLETRSAIDPNQYKDGDAWYTASTEVIQIPVSGRDEPESLKITHTKNGPLISDDPPISLSWTAAHLGDMGIDSILEFNRAQSCDEFASALDRYAAPSLNATFADMDGNIGFRTAGLIPIRGSGNGLAPLDGANPSHRWQGFVPPAELPAATNPEQGFLAAANARVNADSDGRLVSADNAPGYRIRRIKDVLSSRDDFTTNDMRKLQIDWYDQQAAWLMPMMMESLDQSLLSPRAKQAFDVLHRWQGNWIASPESAAAIIFQAWYRALAVEVFQPAMPEDLFMQLFRNNYLLNHALDRLILEQPQNPWWRAERPALISRALSNAVDQISQTQGVNVQAWRLDRMHQVLLEHELGKAVPQLAWFFNAKPAPWGGGPSTVGRARYRYDKAYHATAGATMRVVGEMQPPAPSMASVIPGGQSGHPLSRHYQDQFAHWLSGSLLPIAAFPDRVDGNRIQTLTPKTNEGNR